MRNAFAEQMALVAASDDRVVLLSGDIGNKLFDPLKAIGSDRIYNCGVAEANMTGVAAGLAMMGYRPFTYSITPFVTTRCLEQIRVDICYHNLPVTIVGTGAGLSYAELGPTHHSCEDIGMLRLLPNMTVLCPCDAIEAKAAVSAALQQNGPVYIRLGKKGEPIIHQTIPDFIIGRSITIRSGEDICLLSTGNMMSTGLDIADRLTLSGIHARVESFHTVKPRDEEVLTELFENYRMVITLEEHSLIGGFGSAVAEWVADHHYFKTKLIRFGTKDSFLSCVGSQSYARSQYGLDPAALTQIILQQWN